MHNIRYYGDPVLRKISEAVPEITAEIKEFGNILVEKMYEYDGVGLAAPQIGTSLRVIAVDVSENGTKPILLVNPEIKYKSEETAEDTEGCLSVPGISAPVERAATITVTGYSLLDEKEVVFENVTGLFARALQHEIDHLDGIVFVDRVAPVRKALLKSKLKKMARRTGKK